MIRRLIDNPQLILLLRLAVAGIFIYAAYSKILDPAAFAKSVNNYHIIPGPAVNIFALTLPWIELVAGLGILLGFWRRASSLLINLMLVVFTMAVLIAISKGINIDCGCFTQNPEVAGDMWGVVWRDLGFIALALPLLFSNAKGYCWK
ncbi:MAG: DoxX family membrane protein [candidate division Zixibacteria bacterium]|nr:DoxX family membrane protein [candidate division Zixibacteria bacterium]